MKIIHSFWSKPSLGKAKNLERYNGGWRHERYHLISWALSCLSFKNFYPDIELVTDSKGARLFIDELKLPYSSVKVELDKISNYPARLWALGKILAYEIQDSPFIHVDGDVFIWESFGEKIEKAHLLAQNEDLSLLQYQNAIKHLRELGMKFPSLFEGLSLKKEDFKSINAGVFGGNDIEFIHEFSYKSQHFIQNNIGKVNHKLRESLFAIVYEQLFISLLAQKKNIEIQYLIDGFSKKEFDIIDFKNKYGVKKYVHLINKTKYFFEHCREMEMQLLCDYPEYHERIIEYLKKNNVRD